MGPKHTNRFHCVAKQDARAVVREIPEREVARVNDVHVEVDEETPARAGYFGQSALRGGGRIRDEGGSLLETDASIGQERPPRVIGLARIGAEDGEPGCLKQRRAAVEAGQLGYSPAEQV